MTAYGHFGLRTGPAEQLNTKNDRCLWPRFVGQRVKGKQVQILYDLVTVIGECKATRYRAATDSQVCFEGRLVYGSISQETCRPFGTGALCPRPRGIGRIVMQFCRLCGGAFMRVLFILVDRGHFLLLLYRGYHPTTN